LVEVLPVAAGDAHHQRRHLREHVAGHAVEGVPGVGDPQHRGSLGVHLAVDDDRRRASRHRVGDETVAVGLGAADGEEEAPGADLAGIRGVARDLPAHSGRCGAGGLGDLGQAEAHA